MVLIRYQYCIEKLTQIPAYYYYPTKILISFDLVIYDRLFICLEFHQIKILVLKDVKT